HLRLESAPIDEASGELEALVVVSLESGIVPLLKAEEVGRESHVAPPGELERVELLRIAGEPGRLALAEVELTGVLVQAEDRRDRRRSSFRHEEIGRDPFLRLGLIADLLADQVAQIHALDHLGPEVTAGRESAEKAPQDVARQAIALLHLFLFSKIRVWRQ